MDLVFFVLWSNRKIPQNTKFQQKAKKNVVQITCILSLTKNHFELKNAINTELCKKFGQKQWWL